MGAAKRGGAVERWTGSLGLADANYYMQDGWKTRSYNTGNHVQHAGVNHNGKEYEKNTNM